LTSNFGSQAAHAGVSIINLPAQTQSVFVMMANAGLRPLRPGSGREKSVRMAFGMPETNLSRRRSAENMGILTFWHLACQK
jgi:hypothetical protein